MTMSEPKCETDDALIEAAREAVWREKYKAINARRAGILFDDGQEVECIARAVLAAVRPLIEAEERAKKVAVVESWCYTNEELAMFRQQLREGHEKARAVVRAIRQGPRDEGEG